MRIMIHWQYALRAGADVSHLQGVRGLLPAPFLEVGRRDRAGGFLIITRCRTHLTAASQVPPAANATISAAASSLKERELSIMLATLPTRTEIGKLLCHELCRKPGALPEGGATCSTL